MYAEHLKRYKGLVAFAIKHCRANIIFGAGLENLPKDRGPHCGCDHTGGRNRWRSHAIANDPEKLTSPRGEPEAGQQPLDAGPRIGSRESFAAMMTYLCRLL